MCVDSELRDISCTGRYKSFWRKLIDFYPIPALTFSPLAPSKDIMLEKLFAHISDLGVTQYRLKDCALAGTYVLGLVLIVRRILMGNRGSLPPGPKGWPIIKNILDIPAEYQWKTFLKWSREYSEWISSLSFSFID